MNTSTAESVQYRVRLEAMLHDSIVTTRLLGHRETDSVTLLDYVYTKPVGDFDDEIADLWIAYGALLYGAGVAARVDDDTFVKAAGEWVVLVFGTELTNNLKERCFRFTEELFECMQAAKVSQGTVRRIIAEAYALDLRYGSLRAHQSAHLQQLGGKLTQCSHLTKTDYRVLRETKLSVNQQRNATIIERWKTKPKSVRIPYQII